VHRHALTTHPTAGIDTGIPLSREDDSGVANPFSENARKRTHAMATAIVDDTTIHRRSAIRTDVTLGMPARAMTRIVSPADATLVLFGIFARRT
jgi:hypothetical protein